MGTFSIWHWLIVLAVVLILFGGSGKISSLMGDVAKGIRSFKKGLQEEDDTNATDADRKALEDNSSETEARTADKQREEEKAGG